MKRLFVLLSLAAALLVTAACSAEYNLSVEAWADITYENGSSLKIGPVHYGGFHRRSLSDTDLEYIFSDLLTKGSGADFKTGILYLEIYDEIGGKPLRDEAYGVVYGSRSGHYEFADLNINY